MNSSLVEDAKIIINESTNEKSVAINGIAKSFSEETQNVGASPMPNEDPPVICKMAEKVRLKRANVSCIKSRKSNDQ